MRLFDPDLCPALRPQNSPLQRPRSPATRPPMRATHGEPRGQYEIRKGTQNSLRIRVDPL
jgi:hypothetical protein